VDSFDWSGKKKVLKRMTTLLQLGMWMDIHGRG
jgi:hypothetical protein